MSRAYYYFNCRFCKERVDLSADKAERLEHQQPCARCGSWEHAGCNHPEEPKSE
jgi:hypothetical protein